jgi:C1A family cysteine protease
MSWSAVVVSVGVVRSAWLAPNGIIDAERGRKTPGNHAVLAVGVLTDSEQLIIKNSWGDRWGQAGFGLVSRRYLDHYGLRAHVLERP